jgi:hypothetical protein
LVDSRETKLRYKVVTLLKELRGLVTQEHYSRALTRFKKEGKEILGCAPSSSECKELLLLAAKTYNGNTLPQEAEIYLQKLESENPEIENDFDYIE